MQNQFTIFEYGFNDPELEREFESFFEAFDLVRLFTDEHRAGSIKVSYLDAKSVVNMEERIPRTGKDAFDKKGNQRYWIRKEGAAVQPLIRFHDYMLVADDNKSYREAIFKIIHDATNFQTLLRQIISLMNYMDSQIDFDRQWNQWNIVFYNKHAYK